MKSVFLRHEHPTLVSMVQGASAARVEELMHLSYEAGAEGFGIQLETLNPEERTKEIYERLFSVYPLPTYVTNYRFRSNSGKSDETLAEELVEIASAGATLVDVMGDFYCPTPGELTMDACAIEKQRALMERIHAAGAQVLMSSHTKRVMRAEEVLEYAMEQQARGADIAKIVSLAETEADEVEAMRAILLLKEKLSIPFLYLVGGECKILRRVGGKLGNCMHLGVYEYDALATPIQPLIRDLKASMELLY